MYILFEASGETSSINPGPFTLGELIEKQMRSLAKGNKFLYWEKDDLNKLISLKVGESFSCGLNQTYTRLPDEEWVEELYCKRISSTPEGWDHTQFIIDYIEKKLNRKIECSVK